MDSQEVGLYVNHPPIVDDAPLKMNVISLGEEYRFQINITDPNSEDDLIYTAIEMPDGMRMDPYGGMLVWEPTRENIYFSNLIIDVSDGRTSQLIKADFFVNAPIDIVSIPPMQGLSLIHI